MEEVRINSVPLEMEVDNGAALSLIRSETYHKFAASHMELMEETKVHLQTTLVSATTYLALSEQLCG